MEHNVDVIAILFALIMVAPIIANLVKDLTVKGE